MARATCSEEGVWGGCECVGPAGGTGGTGGTGPTTCGNGSVDPGEQCDGANLNGQTCLTLGEADGMLACDAVTCMYDTSMCGGGTGAVGGGAG